MSKENLLDMLETLCKYNNVEIKHTFSLQGQPQVVVSCLKNTRTIEIHNLVSNTIMLYDDLEIAAEAIHLLTNVDSKD